MQGSHGLFSLRAKRSALHSHPLLSVKEKWRIGFWIDSSETKLQINCCNVLQPQKNMPLVFGYDALMCFCRETLAIHSHRQCHRQRSPTKYSQSFSFWWIKPKLCDTLSWKCISNPWSAGRSLYVGLKLMISVVEARVRTTVVFISQCHTGGTEYVWELSLVLKFIVQHQSLRSREIISHDSIAIWHAFTFAAFVEAELIWRPVTWGYSETAEGEPAGTAAGWVPPKMAYHAFP